MRIQTLLTTLFPQRVLALLACVAMGSLLLDASKVHAQDSLDLNEAERMMNIEVVELRDQLVFGLRTSIPGQQEFIEIVIAKVEAGEIPRAMVNVVFVWARKRNPRMPYPYFEVALRLLADRRGVEIAETESLIVAE